MKEIMHVALEIEQAVLGAIILCNECLDKIIQLVKSPKIFYSEVNRIIYNTMVKMYNSNLPVDTSTLFNELKKEGRLESIGGAGYLSNITSNIYSAANVEYHVKILIEKWLLREMLASAENIIKRINTDSGDDAFEIHSESLSDFESIMEKLELVRDDKTLYENLNSDIEDVKERAFGEKEGGLMCRTFPTLNKFTGGIRETDYIGILGDYKQGKSYLSQQIALDFALYDNLPIVIFNLEMKGQAVRHRAYSLRTGIDYNKLRNPKDAGLTMRELEEFQMKAEKTFKGSKIYISDIILDKNGIKAKMKLLKKKYGIKLFVIDYLNLIEVNEKKERRDLEISTLSRFFKNTASELEVPIIVLSQVNDKGISAESKGLMRDADFLISIKKPLEAGIKSINIKGETLICTDNHFLVTIENSRHGKNGYSFVAGFTNNNFVELAVGSAPVYTPVKNYYEKEEEFLL
jgi:replicative DNA helicase